MSRTHLVNGIRVPFTSEEERLRDLEEADEAAKKEQYILTEKYKDDRRQKYPPIGEQLDLLWHAMNTGEIPKATAWFESIQTVKNNHPKPTTN